jgi:hypothetical protein
MILKQNLKTIILMATQIPMSYTLVSQSYYQPNPITPDLKLNSDGFRSDEFKKNHEEKHILFSGCSVTYGLGLLENETWAKKLYNKINKEVHLSGFFNLALPGTGICDIVANIFKYINNYGKPESIFICLPNVQRRYALYSKDSKKIHDKKIHHAVYDDKGRDEFSDIIQIHSFHYLMFLEMFCKSNNVNLFYFSYNTMFASMELDNFAQIDRRDFIRTLAEFCIKNPDNQFSLSARDGDHFGEAYHEYWANFCHEMYAKGQNK